jgi:hypothetical protein
MKEMTMEPIHAAIVMVMVAVLAMLASVRLFERRDLTGS